MVATGSPKAATRAVAATTAVSDSGIARCTRDKPTTTAPTKPTMASVRQAELQSACVITVQAATAVRSPAGAAAPNAAGTC